MYNTLKSTKERQMKMINILVICMMTVVLVSTQSMADKKNYGLTKKALVDGNYTKALSYALKAYEVDQAVNKSDTNITISTDLNNIGYVYERLEKYDKALEYYQRSLKIKEKKYGKYHKDITITQNNIASVYDKKKEYKKAIEYYKKVIEGYNELLEADHAYKVITYEDIALDYGRLKEYDHALEYYLKAVDIKEKILPITHPKLFETYKNIAVLSEILHKKELALKYYTKILPLYKARFGDDNQTEAIKKKIELFSTKKKSASPDKNSTK
jgi:tetratricopeptide (TPR) repeat protein